MTVIVWDGKTLAADRLVSRHGLIQHCRKVHRLPDHLAAFAGTYSQGLAMMAWFKAGAEPKDFPAPPDKDAATDLIVVDRAGTLLLYENAALPLIFLDATYVAGSGREVARGALEMGADAKRAVEVASKWETSCGGGVDTLTFDEQHSA